MSKTTTTTATAAAAKQPAAGGWSEHQPDGAPTNESIKSGKFRKFAARRVNNALNRLRQVGNLANRNVYSYTQAEANKIIAALEQALVRVKNAYAGVEDSDGFTL